MEGIPGHDHFISENGYSGLSKKQNFIANKVVIMNFLSDNVTFLSRELSIQTVEKICDY